jgi:hypothetical protein
MKKTSFYLILAICLSSCVAYDYSAPFSAPPALEQQGDVDIGGNISIAADHLETGLKAAAMPFKSVYLQYNFQFGTFQEVVPFAASDHKYREMQYTYHEFASGYLKNYKSFSLVLSPFIGIGRHKLKVVDYNLSYPYWLAERNSRLLQPGFQFSFICPQEKDVLVIPSLRVQQFQLGHIQTTAKPGYTPGFDSTNKAWVISPSLSLVKKIRHTNVSLILGYANSLGGRIDMKVVYCHFSVSVNFNYLHRKRKDDYDYEKM